jgi:hypothetical protein
MSANHHVTADEKVDFARKTLQNTFTQRNQFNAEVDLRAAHVLRLPQERGHSGGQGAIVSGTGDSATFDIYTYALLSHHSIAFGQVPTNLISADLENRRIAGIFDTRSGLFDVRGHAQHGGMIGSRQPGYYINGVPAWHNNQIAAAQSWDLGNFIMRLPNGTVLQAGVISTPQGGVDYTVTFPLAFRFLPIIFAMPDSLNPAITINVRNPAATNFVLRANLTGLVRTHWLALGQV